jgi:hypothetical protein
MEAAKYLSNVEEFRPAGLELLQKSQFLSSIIQMDTVEKMSDDQVKSVLDEIFSVDTEDKK